MSDTVHKKLESREHILLRPNMYVGAIDPQTFSDYVDGKLTELKYIPGLVKIINEIIDNSVDIAIKTDFKKCNLVDVKVQDDYIEVLDNGPGIPVTKNSDGEYLPRVCWGYAMSGSNFGDDSERKSIGMNGVGSYCTNVWSTKFIGVSDDGQNRYKITFTDNAQNPQESLSVSSKRGVQVKFYPDLARFKIDKIDDTVKSVIKQRLINLNMCFPKIKFRFNNKDINVKDFKKYVSMFSENFELYESDNYQFAILPSTSDEFQHFSFVNGLKMPDGGQHVDVISSEVTKRIREKLKKKYKTIKPADIKNKLMVVMFMRGFPSPKFNSQTKEKLTNSISEVNTYLGNIDYDVLCKKILKNEKIINPIIEVFKIKEEYKKRQELNALNKAPKKIKDEHYLGATKNKRVLFICEGASALGGLMPCFGRDEYGYYTLKGKPLNAWSSSQQKFTANKELSGLYQVVKNEGYEKIVFATDADLDGFHIRSLLSGFFRKYLPEYSVGMLETPVIASFKNGKIQKWSYDLNDSLELSAGETSFYYKGLGSWNKDDFKVVLSKDGIDKMIEPLTFNDSDETIEDWLGNDSAPRKEYIINNNFSIADI